MMTRKIIKSITKGLFVYLLLISICCSLLFLSFSLDGDIESNASIGICKISNGEIYPKVLEHYLPMPWTYFLSSWAHYLQQDKFTDREMLKAVIAPGDNIFERAMVPEYGRYWHGYLVFLRPVLMFFPYEEIKYLGLIVHILGISIIYFSVKRISDFLAKGLVVSFLLYGWLTAWLSFQFYSAYFIVYAAGSLVTRIKKETYPIFFFITGMAVAFFDLLSVPLLTLGIPLLIIYAKEKRTNFTSIFLYCILWLIGYGLFWMAKPLIATYILQQNIIADFYHQAMYRIGGSIPRPTEMPIWLQALTMNGRVLVGLIPIFLFFRKKIFWNINNGMPLLFIGGMPILWVCILANHSAIHYWFTARVFMISCFALIVYIYKIDDYKNSHENI
ncbi:hypothetical protein [Desulfovibrio piger]|uniref:hypothetical protein n=2 Tax=Desulfovibrio piger TaxID=901 RepID=UPI0039F5E84D